VCYRGLGDVLVHGLRRRVAYARRANRAAPERRHAPGRAAAHFAAGRVEAREQAAEREGSPDDAGVGRVEGGVQGGQQSAPGLARRVAQRRDALRVHHVGQAPGRRRGRQAGTHTQHARLRKQERKEMKKKTH
jgi:hypothetical protein